MPRKFKIVMLKPDDFDDGYNEVKLSTGYFFFISAKTDGTFVEW